jgi:hypothetical protein
MNRSSYSCPALPTTPPPQVRLGRTA